MNHLSKLPGIVGVVYWKADSVPFADCIRMHVLSLACLLACFSFGMPLRADVPAQISSPRGDLVLIVGAPGTPEYAELFQQWANKWTTAASTGQVRVHLLGLTTTEATLENVQTLLTEMKSEETLPLWVVLIGHGTFDGRSTRFNLPGTDLEPVELQRLLKGISRPVAVINCTSASAPFLEELSAPGRVIITATSSGNEVNFAHFGGFLAESIGTIEADLDKDQQVSLLEAFLRASRLTEEFYAADGRLPTEHSLLDDNGDAHPVPASGFEGIRPIHREATENLLPDGMIAHQWHLIPSEEDAALPPEILARRNELEQQVAQLRNRKDEMSEDAYYAALEPLFVELAKLLEP